MGIFNWLFGSSGEDIHTPPPLEERASAGQAQRQGQDSLHWRASSTTQSYGSGKLAIEHGVSAGAVAVLAEALSLSQGRAAQFSHPELGGMGQWMSGGMLMIGDMFNHELKAKVDRLCHAVAAAIANAPREGSGPREQPRGDPIGWWPAAFGTPSAAGAQNAMRYAFFRATKRLAVDDNGTVSFYDTGEHYLTGVSQQQSSTQTLTFTSTDGMPIPLASLKRISAAG